MCKGKQCPNSDKCKCNKDNDITYTVTLADDNDLRYDDNTLPENELSIESKDIEGEAL